MGRTAGRQPCRKRAAGRKPHGRDGGQLFRKALALLEERLDSQDLKSSLADLIRLLKVSRELEGSNPGPVEVRWVESEESD